MHKYSGWCQLLKDDYNESYKNYSMQCKLGQLGSQLMKFFVEKLKISETKMVQF